MRECELKALGPAAQGKLLTINIGDGERRLLNVLIKHGVVVNGAINTITHKVLYNIHIGRVIRHNVVIGTRGEK